jgi:hypothetical protein
VGDEFVILSSGGLVPNLNIHAPRLNGKSIGPHQAKGFGQSVFDGIDGCQDAHQGHDSKGYDEYGQDGPEQIGPDGLQGDPYIFKKHGCFHGEVPIEQ